MKLDEIKKKVVMIAVLLIVAPVFLSIGYVMIVLNWSYSKGDRVGYR